MARALPDAPGRPVGHAPAARTPDGRTPAADSPPPALQQRRRRPRRASTPSSGGDGTWLPRRPSARRLRRLEPAAGGLLPGHAHQPGGLGLTGPAVDCPQDDGAGGRRTSSPTASSSTDAISGAEVPKCRWRRDPPGAASALHLVRFPPPPFASPPPPPRGWRGGQHGRGGRARVRRQVFLPARLLHQCGLLLTLSPRTKAPASPTLCSSP